MGDVVEVQITPETPGRPSIRNPFESPTDYHHLHEPLVPSPSVFKCAKPSSATPAKFKWSIDELANLLPVHIDPEDIHRQALYLSQTRTDTDIEEKRQNAIEMFFTKGAIVPSPWAPQASKQSVQPNFQKSPLSPVIVEEPQSAKKINATCQTILSLPVDFNLEKVLGDYYRTEEISEQVQESLSSSSLRRKLFLDGHGSGSESSTPSSPDRETPAGSAETMSSVIVSPPECGIATTTPSSGQFSSSPIQDRSRAYSLGSIASPMFPERSSPVFQSPTLSPITLPHSLTPLSGERKRLSFLTPDVLQSGSRSMAVNRCGESPYVEGCSPIRSCSPLHPRTRNRGCVWGSPAHISPILPDLHDKENIHPSEPLPTMDLDACSPGPKHEGLRPSYTNSPAASLPDLEQMEQGEPPESDLSEVPMGKALEEADEEVEEVCNWTPEEDTSTASPVRLTSSRTGNVSNVESTRMFVSLLAEGSITPYDVSMQVDSGYNTYSTCTTSLMDAISSDSQSKELQDTHTAEEGLSYSKNTNSKLVIPLH
ncbi:protein aurora borealis isoform X1 [Astyanax mexicanus]|uniref:protein aurora borealis isoform X1 n=1 Tax=Astyanax mexicanus TaxID=7994 RepID=UPI0020CB4C4A|nr:protein aurora borealis isoform X1 [Astyanax mexicanus]